MPTWHSFSMLSVNTAVLPCVRQAPHSRRRREKSDTHPICYVTATIFQTNDTVRRLRKYGTQAEVITHFMSQYCCRRRDEETNKFVRANSVCKTHYLEGHEDGARQIIVDDTAACVAYD